MEQESFPGCFVCGTDNPSGLAARFRLLPGGEVEGTCEAFPRHAGYQGVLHGAAVMGILDETLGRLAMARGRLFLTHSLTVTFRKAAEVGEALRSVGRLLKWGRREFTAEGELFNAKGEVVATARGRFLLMSQRMEERFRTTPPGTPPPAPIPGD